MLNRQPRDTRPPLPNTPGISFLKEMHRSLTEDREAFAHIKSALKVARHQVMMAENAGAQQRHRDADRHFAGALDAFKSIEETAARLDQEAKTNLETIETTLDRL